MEIFPWGPSLRSSEVPGSTAKVIQVAGGCTDQTYETTYIQWEIHGNSCKYLVQPNEHTLMVRVLNKEFVSPH